jgi:SAM-dependent methyltransferase
MRRWERNAEFWVRIIRERRDRFRTEVTDGAVLRALGPCRDTAILDAGCGEGYLTRRLAGRGADAVGVDRSAALIRAAGAAGRHRTRAARFVNADLCRLPFVAGRFDVVLCNHSLNELRDLRPAFAEFARVLRAGGHLVVLMLHPCFYGGRDRTGRRADLDSDRYFAPRRVEQYFDVGGLRSPAPTVIWLRPLEAYFDLLAMAGFAVERLWEPRPSRRLMADPWWRANFRTPVFLLFRAVRVG